MDKFPSTCVVCVIRWFAYECVSTIQTDCAAKQNQRKCMYTCNLITLETIPTIWTVDTNCA